MSTRKAFLPLNLALMLTFPVQARNIGGNVYKMCRNDIFTDYENRNVKKIVTETNGDGTFQAEDLGVWLRNTGIYDISLLREEDNYLKEEFYSFQQERVDDAYYYNEDASYVDFTCLVKAGDVITASDTETETVERVEIDGSFTTRTETTVNVNALLPAVLVPRTAEGETGEKSSQTICITGEMEFVFESIIFDGENSSIEITCGNGVPEDSEYYLEGTDDTGKMVKYRMNRLENTKAIFTNEEGQGVSRQASSADLQLYKYETDNDISEQKEEYTKIGEMFCMILS